MMYLIEWYLLPFLNLSLAIGSLVVFVVVLILLADYFLNNGDYFYNLVQKFAWPTILFVTIGSVFLSLVYSEYFGFIPCSLCWLQRIAIYPQALMSVLAFKRKDTIQFPVYGIALSSFGLVVALYQYAEQMLPKDGAGNLLPCLADGSNADCATKVIDMFGFVTFPFVAAASFAFLIVVYLYMLKGNTDKR